ncbi:MAG: hypothetical protein ACI4HO_10270 [Ruminococcus sp.]
MKRKQSLDRRMMISKNSILMLVLLVTVFIAVWAWFAESTEDAVASGFSAKANDLAPLDLALPNEDGSYPTEDSAYSSTIDFDKQISLVRSMVSDVTSDGLHFIIPTTTQSSGVRIVQENEKWNKAVAQKDYVSIPFYVRSPSPDIYVSGFSKVDATLKDESDKIVNESDVSNISRNGVVGAMRISIIDMTKDITDDNISTAGYKPVDRDLKFFWLPRPDLYLNAPSDSSWELMTEVTKDTVLGTGADAGDTYKHYYWAIKESGEKDLSSGTGVTKLSYPVQNLTEDWFWVSDFPNGDTSKTPTLGTNRKIGNGKIFDDENQEYVDMTKVTMNDTEYYVYKFVMNIWVEGTDAEARRALNNGEFKLDIRFCTGE